MEGIGNSVLRSLDDVVLAVWRGDTVIGKAVRRGGFNADFVAGESQPLRILHLKVTPRDDLASTARKSLDPLPSHV